MDPFILTAHGHDVDMTLPTQGSITQADIAHHLAQINRFVGACRRPYSVAEHSLLVCEIAERELGISDPGGLLAALMHDAHEAYIGDLNSPAKHVLGAPWHQLEARFERLVRSAFSLHTASMDHCTAIKTADLIALATERQQLMPRSPTLWQCLQGVQPVTWVDLMDSGRCRFDWDDWRRAFADKADELDFARNLRHHAVRGYDA